MMPKVHEIEVPLRPDHDREGNRCPVAPGWDLRRSDRDPVREV